MDTKEIETALLSIKAAVNPKPEKKHLMCIYFFCQKCYRDWSVDTFVPKLEACKCGNQKPRVTQIENIDHLRNEIY